MLMSAEPIFRAVEEISQNYKSKSKIILLSPQETLKSEIGAEVIKLKRLILICGRV